MNDHLQQSDDARCIFSDGSAFRLQLRPKHSLSPLQHCCPFWQVVWKDTVQLSNYSSMLLADIPEKLDTTISAFWAAQQLELFAAGSV